MRFMIMHKLNDRLEKGIMPTEAEIAEIHGMMGEAAQAGIMLGGEGLHPSSARVHVAYKDGRRTVTEGPFTDKKELIGGFAQLVVKSQDEALAWLDRFAEIMGDVEIFMGPCTEPWDLGMAPKPENPPLRLLAMHQMTAAGENEVPPSPERMAKMGALVSEMTEAGVLRETDGLASSRHGARIHFDGENYTVTDGPFAESKELISGYAIFELPSKEAAIEWGTRWCKCVRVEDVEIRRMFDPA